MLFNIGCGDTSPRNVTGFYFDTVVSITVYNEKDLSIAQNALDKCGEYEKLFSRTMEGSDVYNINHKAGSFVNVNPLTLDLIENALYYCKLSEGKIDITVAPLSELWNFSENAGSEDPLLPSKQSIEDALCFVDYENVLLSQEDYSVCLHNENMGIDLGFIAKGYIGDLLREHLEAEGVESAIINLGGNITVIGKKPDGNPYTIGIKKPFSESGESIFSVSLTNQSVSTCGIYERYFINDDTLYHHILDTKTGYPYETDILSVTVISDSATMSDGLATTLFLLGPTEGLSFAKNNPGCRVIYVTKDYTVLDSASQ